MEAHKVNIINMLQLLSDQARQDKYEKNVPIADVTVELINGWFDDSFLKEFDWFKELFSEHEWSVLSEFDNFYEARLGKLPDSYPDLRRNFFWKEIVGKANWVLATLGWQDLVVAYDDCNQK